MNIKGLLFYFSLFINKKERNQSPMYILKSLAIKRINKGINQITKEFKRHIFIPSSNITAICNSNDYTKELDDVYILQLVKTAIE
jgi:hypothetical protein